MDNLRNAFTSLARADQVACVYNRMQFHELADHYIRSADALVSMALDDSALLDVHVQPACFLYRHGLELMLKDLAWKIRYLVSGKKIYAQQKWHELGKHRLSVIWSVLKDDAREVLAHDFPLDSDAINRVATVIKQFEAHDPDSMSFRYPVEKKKGQAHSRPTHVNLSTL